VATATTRAILAVVVGVLVASTVVGLVLLWPSGAGEDRPDFAAPGATFPKGSVADVREVPCPGSTSAALRCGEATVRVDEGADAGLVVTVAVPPEVMAAGLGDRVVLVRSPAQGGIRNWTLQDLDRARPLLLLAAVFVMVVLLVARWRGALALVGLGVAAVLMVEFMLPALIAGKNPILVALTAASAIMVVVLYLAHGLSVRTTTALLGTFAGLGLTAGIASWSVSGAHLTGVSSDDSALLRQQLSGLSPQDLLLCGIILAGLGVLNDVTITQSSAVWELCEAAPQLSRSALFSKAMRIGRDHIASTIYTIVFAYAGAALSVLMLIVLYAQPLTFTLSSNDIAEELVRTLASAIGLVLAVPITTGLAALLVPAGQHGSHAQTTTP
jgi:uncharacterized membrane protein